MKAGMVPAENIRKSGKQLKKVRNYSLFSSNNALIKRGAEGLTKKEIAVLKNAARNSNVKELRISQTISFSPFLFVSVLLSLILFYL